MIRRPPRSTRTDTLFPYTTLFRSQVGIQFAAVNGQQAIPGELDADSPQGRQIARIHTHHLGQVVAEIAPQRAQQIVDEEDGGGIYLAVLRHRLQIGRAHVGTPVTNAHLVCRLLLEKKNNYNTYTSN